MTATLIRFLAALIVTLASATPAAAQSYLWEVTSLTNRVYLFGTVHAGRPEWFPLPRDVEDAFNDSTILVVEADITNADAMKKSSAAMTYAPPDTLRNHVAQEDYERFRRLLPRYKLPEAQVVRVKPFMAASLLIFGEWARVGYQPQYGVDAYLIQKAVNELKPIVEIEGVETQIKLMDSLTERETREFFRGTLSALENSLTSEQIAGMVGAWQLGNSTLMLDMARRYNEKVPGAAEFEEKFIWSRHPEMLEKIEGYLTSSKDRYFIALGALHLAGPRGLVEMLRSRGYLVKQR